VSESSPLRVGMVVAYDLAEPGGVKHHAFELARALRARGDDVTLIGPSSGPVDGAVVFGGIANVVSNGSDNRLGLFVPPWRIWRYFRQQKFDILHLHDPLLPALPYWAILGAGRTARVATFHAYGEHLSALLRGAARGFAALQFPFIHHAMAVSPAAAQHAAANWRRPMEIVPNGVRTDLFVPGGHSSGRGPLRLLFVGRGSDERKGLGYLVEAFRQARGLGLDVELSVVGDNTRSAQLPEMRGVRYHGVVSRKRLVEEYQRCDVFVAPSTGQESFGIVLLEAMACGKPVICSDIQGYRTTVDRASAMMVRPGNVPDLVAAIRHMTEVRGNFASIAEVNRRHAERYDWSRVAVDVRGEYLQALMTAQLTRWPATESPRMSALLQEPSSASQTVTSG
jgi:phosphatidyl-myo-inositol alpha-mannosyltransferase